MTNKKKTTKKLNKWEEKILLEEYNHIMSFLQFSNDVLHRFATFYFTVISIFLGIFFLVLTQPEGNISIVIKSLIIMIISLISIITLTFWYANASRTRIKLYSRLERAKDIEFYFHNHYKNKLPKRELYNGNNREYFDSSLFQMHRFTENHLSINKSKGSYDVYGKKIPLLSNLTGVMSELFPIFLVIFWTEILIGTIFFNHNEIWNLIKDNFSFFKGLSFCIISILIPFVVYFIFKKIP